jgi:hypothetical protein
MKIRDEINFWANDKLLASLSSSIVPLVGTFVNIKKKTYKITYVSYCVDYADRIMETRMRTNVELEPSKNGTLFIKRG